MRWLTWHNGRQAGGYSKLPLLPQWMSVLFNAAAYILKFPTGTGITEHTDPVEKGYNHYRINITLWKSRKDAGMFIRGPCVRFLNIEFFRPDLYTHGMQQITGRMYILSFGLRVKQHG
jgi:hypothetical protein